MADEHASGFDVNQWLNEAKGPVGVPGRPGDTPSQLLAELTQARQDGDPSRLLRLTQALRSVAPSLVDETLQAELEQAALTLIERTSPTALDHAASWAQTWNHCSEGPEAGRVLQDLQARVQAVRDHERELRACLSGEGPLSALVMALHGLATSRDRCTGTDTLIAEGQALLDRRERELSIARKRLQTLIPGRLDEASVVMTGIFNAEPDRTNQELLSELHARSERVRQHLQVARAALDRRHLPDLQRALTTLETDADRIAGADAVIAQLRTLRDEMQAQIEHRREDFRSFLDRRELDKAIRALRDLIDLDPAVPEARQLPLLIKERQKMVAASQDLEQAIASADAADIEHATRRFQRVAGERGQPLVERARTTVDTIKQQRAQRRRGLILGGAIIAFLIAVPAVIHVRDKGAYRKANSVADPAERTLALQAFLDDPSHLLYRQAAKQRLAALAVADHSAALAAAMDHGDAAERLTALQAFLDAHPEGSGADLQRRQADEAIAATRRAIDDARHRTAATVGDPRARIAALEAYLASDGELRHGDDARLHIERLHQRLDEEAWERASVPADRGIAERIAALETYLAGDTRLVHADTAHSLIAGLRREAAEQAVVHDDQAAWKAVETISDPQQQLAAAGAYLERPEPRRFDHLARALCDTLTRRLDDAEWQAVLAAADDLPRQLRLAKTYLDRPAPLRTGEATRLIGTIERTIDDAAWNDADLPGTPEARIARFTAYLDAAHRKFRAEDARSRIAAATEQADRGRFERARALDDPIARVLALDAYLESGSNPERRKLAEGHLRSSLAAVADLDARTLQGAPVEILVRLPPERIQALPPAVLALLPEEALLDLPPRTLARLGPLLERLPARVARHAHRRPRWAADSGIDAHGAWADLVLGDRPLRFRWLPGGSCTLPIDGEEVPLLIGDAGYWLAETELPQAGWEAVLGRRANPSPRRGDDLPVHGTSSSAIDAFLAALHRRLRRTPGADGLRLPSLDELAWAGLTGPVDGHWPQAAHGDWQAPHGSGDPTPCLGTVDAKGFHHLLDNVAEWATRGEARVLAMGPFPVPIPGMSTAAPTPETPLPHAGLRLAIAATADDLAP